MQMVRREHAAIIVQIMHCRLKRLLFRPHFDFGRHMTALFQIAGRAGSDNIFPCRLPAATPRDNVIKCQILWRTAILALKPVTQEYIKARESGMTCWFDIVFQTNDAWQLHRKRRRGHFLFILCNNIYTIKKHCLDCVLP